MTSCSTACSCRMRRSPARRKPGVWHPLLHLVSMIAFPIVYSVYTGIAEAARDIAVAQAAKRRDPASRPSARSRPSWRRRAWPATRSWRSARPQRPAPETTNTVFMYRSLIARSALRTVDLAMDVAGGAAYFRKRRPRAAVPRRSGRALSSADGQRAAPPRRPHRARSFDRWGRCVTPTYASDTTTPPRCANNVAAHSSIAGSFFAADRCDCNC